MTKKIFRAIFMVAFLVLLACLALITGVLYDNFTRQQSDQLSAQQATLDSQQAQIEQLVGVRTQIISALSGALRTANISATVDPTSGAIALESDVLFATGEYSLTEEQGRELLEALKIMQQIGIKYLKSHGKEDVLIEKGILPG